MILQKIKKSIEKIGIPCFLDYNDATSYCAVLIPETNGKESIKVDIQFIWEDGNPMLLADKWIKSLRMNKELKVIVLGSGNNYAGFVLRVKVIDVSICSYIPTGNRYTITIENDPEKGTVSGAGKYLEGKTCTLTCTPFEQYYFDYWEESVGTLPIYDNPYTIIIEEDITFTAHYGTKYHVEVVSAGNGTVSGSGYYEPTETCTITATPNTGYHFVNWTVSGLELTTDNPYSFIPTGDITITANFIPYYDISVSSSGNGTVSGGGTYNSGETVSLSATPNEGYVFVNWTENGVEVSTSNPYTFTCTENRTIVGNFVMTPLKITTNANSSVDLINANNQTYTWNLTAGLNEYYGDVSGFALNEITSLKRTVVNSWDYAILSIDASVLTSWTTVATNSFRLCQNLDTFVLPDTITTIGNYSFQQCGLTSINLSEGLISIGDSAFQQCHFSSISVPASLTSINSSAFSQVAQYITTITVDSNNTVYNDGNGSNCLIETATDTLILGCNRNDAVIPSGIKVIGQQAFASCNNITSITLPDSLTTINNWAFINCYYLESISIPANVSTLVNPFLGCSGLTSITVDSNNTIYNDGNGSNCIIETATDKLIVGCNYTTIPNTVVAIGNGAFQSCTFISITLPSSLTTIGQQAFASCMRLQTLTIPASVSSIGHSAFWGDNLIYMEFEGTTPATLETTSIFSGSYPLYVPSSAVSAYQTAWSTYASRITAKPEPTGSDYVYVLASSNTSVMFKNANNEYYTWSVNAGINYYEGTEPGFALNEITGLKKSAPGWDNYLAAIDASSLTSWTTVEDRAFLYCGELASIVLPNSITSIGQEAFSNGQKLSSITLSSSLIDIGRYAFNGCNWLTSITLPNSLTTIGYGAFNYCTRLTSITFSNSLTTIEQYAFQGCSGLTSITLPSSLISIGDYAFSSCSGLTSITLPEGLTTIGNQILTGTSLTSITIPSSVSSIGASLTVNSPVSEVYCLPTTPPGPSPTTGRAFNEDSTVYIPNGSLSAYQNGGWRWMSYNYVELP